LVRYIYLLPSILRCYSNWCCLYVYSCDKTPALHNPNTFLSSFKLSTLAKCLYDHRTVIPDPARFITQAHPIRKPVISHPTHHGPKRILPPSPERFSTHSLLKSKLTIQPQASQVASPPPTPTPSTPSPVPRHHLPSRSSPRSPPSSSGRSPPTTCGTPRPRRFR
jgi:hypothetical protein